MGVQIEASIKHLLVFCAAGFLLFHFIQGLQKVQSSQVGLVPVGLTKFVENYYSLYLEFP